MTPYRFPAQAWVRASGKTADPCFRYAVAEIVRLLGRLGIRAATVRGPAGLAGCGLAVGAAAAPPPAPASTSAVRDDGFSIRVASAGVAINAPTPKGLLNGVYELAERMGFVFLMPGEAGEWAPETGGGRPNLPLGTFTLNPRFPRRGVFGGCQVAPFAARDWFRFFAKLKFNAVSHEAQDLPLAAETGIRLEVGGHGMSEMLPRELFAKRPELFRMFQPEDFSGKRLNDSNFCCNHPDAKRIVQRNFRRQLEKLRGIYAVHAWADDLPAGGWCMCPLCRSFAPTDQSMIAMRHFAEVIAAGRLPMRVPVAAYHDTLYPGGLVPAPREGFLLFAPRERCYAHALDDTACARNRFYLRALQAWMAKFRGIDDAHTFEYYFDQILFRGLYPFLPDVVLGDMTAYRKAGIQTHMALQVGGPVVAPEFNMLLFAKAHWDAGLTADRFIAETARRIAPRTPAVWERYLQRRRRVFASAMRLCDHSNDVYFDYRWLPETPRPFGRQMARAYARAAADLESAAAALAHAGRGSKTPRARALAAREVGRARFEAADLRAMSTQQAGVNNIAVYVATGSRPALRQGLADLGRTIRRLNQSYRAAQTAGLPANAYYYALNRNWLQRELAAKIKRYRAAFRKR